MNGEKKGRGRPRKNVILNKIIKTNKIFMFSRIFSKIENNYKKKF